VIAIGPEDKAGEAGERRLFHMIARIEVVIATGLLLAVVFTALAHGAVEAWSVAVFELIIASLLLLWTIKVLIDGRLKVAIPAATFPIAALLIIGLIQAVAFTGGDGRRLSLSKDVEATRGAVTVLFYLLASFIIAANFFNTRRRLQALASFLIIYGLGMAVFSLVQHFAWDGRFYWLRSNTQTVSPFGSFVSHNHFAGYMEMLMPVPVALAIARVARGEVVVFYLFAGVMMGIAIITSLSRGGMISLLASMIFLAAVGLRRPDHSGASSKSERLKTAESLKPRLLRAARHPALIVLVVLTAIGAGVLVTGREAVIKRLTSGRLAGDAQPEAETFFSSRGWIWQDTISMIRANPITGVGLGAYQTAYPLYSRADGSLTVSYAHNEYLQVLADGGILGGAVAAWFIVVALRSVARAVKSNDRLLRGLALGSGAGMFALLVHSLLDFNLQVPSNALMFLLLTAVTSQVGAIAAEQQLQADHAARR
jgi:O-antigen ligase